MDRETVREAETGTHEEGAVSRIYELGYHILPSSPEEEIATKEAALKELVSRHGGEVIASEEPRLVELAYAIRRKEGSSYTSYNQAYFGWMKFGISVGEAQTLHKELLGSDFILRHLIFKTVREDTRAGIRGAGVISVRTPSSGKRLVTEDTGGPVSEEDIERTVDELVAQTDEEDTVEKKEHVSQ